MICPFCSSSLTSIANHFLCPQCPGNLHLHYLSEEENSDNFVFYRVYSANQKYYLSHGPLAYDPPGQFFVMIYALRVSERSKEIYYTTINYPLNPIQAKHFLNKFLNLRSFL